MSKVSERELKWLDDYDLKGRSPLYKFIRKNFAQLKKRKAGMDDGPSWARLAEWLAMRGQTNSRGEPLSWDAVRKVFTRVRRDIEAEERERLGGANLKRSPAHMPKGWTPPVAAKSTATQTVPAPFAPTPNKQEVAKPAGAGPRDMLAELWSDIDKRSGR